MDCLRTTGGPRVLNDGKTLDFEIARKEYFDRR